MRRAAVQPVNMLQHLVLLAESAVVQQDLALPASLSFVLLIAFRQELLPAIS
jgi:hypothetical protein